MSIPPPSTKRAMAAFLLAPLAPAMVVALAEPSTTDRLGDFLMVALAGGYVPSLVFGLPLYLALRRHMVPRAPLVAGLGGVVAALLPLLALLASNGRGSATGSHPLAIVDMIFGWSGLSPDAALAVTAFVLGLGGGYVFWLVLVSPLGEIFTRDDHKLYAPYG